MTEEGRRFPMGLSLWDMLKFHFTRGMLPALVIVFFLIMVPLFVITAGGILAGSIGASLLVLAVFSSIVLFAVLMSIMLFIPLVMVKYAMIFKGSDNYTLITRNEVIAYRQGSPFYPVVMNRIQRKLIDRIEPAGEGYIRERWMNTPWYLRMGFIHKYPHGGLYYPLTNKDNLLILYLREPVMVTNEEMDLLRAMRRGPGFLKTLPVKEVVLDVKENDHGKFMRCLN
ncbi:MAG: hypothetical protein QCI82_10675 [Candidatus Thermoplasmatota archaeon]|nr:hypothetical protein [Candidatus Thermoplasmatota archaeon]